MKKIDKTKIKKVKIQLSHATKDAVHEKGSSIYSFVSKALDSFANGEIKIIYGSLEKLPKDRYSEVINVNKKTDIVVNKMYKKLGIKKGELIEIATKKYLQLCEKRKNEEIVCK